MNSGGRLEYYMLFAVGLVAAIWFFVGYPMQDPRSAVSINFDEKEIELKAAEKLSDLGFIISDYTISDVSLSGNVKLLDSLQYKLGRREAIESLADTTFQNIKPYFWEVIFERNKAREEALDDRENSFGPDNSKELRLRIDTNGQFIALLNESDHLPQKKVRRNALGAVFAVESDSANHSVMVTVSDSLLGRLLYFDMQKSFGDYSIFQKKPEKSVQTNFNRGIPYRHSSNDARAIADYHLQKTGWDLSGFIGDTVFIERVNNINAANVRYITDKSILGQVVQLDVLVSPTGSLLKMQSTYNPARGNGGNPNFIWGVLNTAVIFLLGLAGLLIFFFRMRARAIDTQSALVAAVVLGLIVPVYIFLATVDEINPFSSSTPFNESLELFFIMGVVGALASVGFFVLVALSDSITRQHWPSKLFSLDYLRQGMIFNKPIGIILLRSVALAFILAGFWTLLLQFFPKLYIDVNTIFLSKEAAWPPVYLLLENIWFSFSLMMAIFMAIGSQIYGQRNSMVSTILITALACGVLVPVFLSFGPPVYEFLLGTLFGAALAFIYIRWDFLTLLLSHFLFLGLLESTTGWMVSNSPDTYIFVCYLGLLIVIIVAGSLAIFKGKDAHSLPEYIPGYVEELAQEQRIKQELQIAREVQQSFLPVKMPQIARLDIAAVCKPAYETGGDYYDFIQLDEHRAAIAIGDVSGKGIQAAFYMTFVKGLLHSLCRETDSPAEVLKKTNRLFCDNATKGTFISLVYGIIDTQKNEFTFARAGHNPILHINTSTNKVQELQPRGLGIGLTKDKIFDNNIEEIKLSITDDDLFLLYTDGIVEALNETRQFYGTKNLTTLIKKQKNKPAKKVVSSVSKAVTSYIGKAKQHDDMTLMAVRYKRAVE